MPANFSILKSTCHPLLDSYFLGYMFIFQGKRIMPFRKNTVSTFWIIVVTLLVAVGCAHVGSDPHTPPQVLVEKPFWPHEISDLEPDEQAHFGQLPNGLRYILKENKTPRDRVSMHLYVQVGALAESDGEEGLAHFLEHMLFNGSTHFSPGELVEFFQGIGMQFGPDANASTGFAQTIYDILLPKGDPDSIAEGLLVLNDFAQGALLLPDQVEKEIPVVLAEKRSRDSASYRAAKASFAFQMPGTLLPRRFPIGMAEAIRSFDEHKVRHFYDAWYRPERMVLVMVGDFDLQATQQMIEERFTQMPQRADPQPLPDFGRFSHEGVKTFHYFEKELGATSVSIGTIEKQSIPQDNRASRQARLLEEIADRMVQTRLNEMLRSPDSVMTSASIASGDYLQQLRYTDISADTKPENWEKALTLIEQTLRKALTHGFTPAELERAKRVYRADLQRAVDDEGTLQSKDLARGFIANLNQWRVHQSARQRQALLAPMLDSITLEQVNRSFTENWSAPHRLVQVTGNADLSTKGTSPEAYIRTVYKESQATLVEPPAEREDVQFPYLEAPEARGRIAHRMRFEDLGIEQVDFENGVRLIFKKTDLKENEILAALSFGGGKSVEPADQPGLAEMTEAVVNGSGFGELDRVSLENALAGRLAQTFLDVREDMFVVQGRAVRSELPLLFQLYHAFINDTGYRSEALQVALRRFEQQHQSLPHSAEGLMQLSGQAFLAGGDSRFGWPGLEHLEKITLEDIEQWFGDQVANAPLEIVVVGDFQTQAVVEQAARYLGALPPRGASKYEPERSDPIFPNGQALQLSAATAIERGLVMVAFPTDDFWDIQRTRRLNVLADLLSDRMRIRIREDLGAAYSPFAYHRAHRAYPGYGVLRANMLVDPALVDKMVLEVEQIASEMREQGIGADELRRTLGPTLTQIKDLRQSNSYWLNSVLIGSSRHPEQLDWARDMEADFSAINAEEMTELARQYLVKEKAARIIIVPGR
jgi:zinc protease